MSAAKRYEVELKFPVSHPNELQQRLAERGIVFGAPEVQVDQYFGHPSRDFSQTDEALRLRQVNDDVILTYKGPVVDHQTKTREEIEVMFGSGGGQSAYVQGVAMTQILQRLGFRPVREVRKTRRSTTVPRGDVALTCTWDEVFPLGVFLEVELVAAANEKDAARQAILEWAAELELGTPERRSYLEMLLAADAGSPAPA